MDAATAAACCAMLVSSPEHEGGGSGLGLYYSQNIVEAHGGKLRIQSELGVGTRMSFQLPVDICVTPRPRSMARTPRESPRMISSRCLLVDDTSIVIKILTKLLVGEGHSVTSRSDGTEALDLLVAQRQTFDICFIDNTMPGMNGPEAVTKFRTWEQQHSQGRMYICGLTGAASSDDHKVMLDAGCDVVLSKPCSREDLRREILTAQRRASVAS